MYLDKSTPYIVDELRVFVKETLRWLINEYPLVFETLYESLCGFYAEEDNQVSIVKHHPCVQFGAGHAYSYHQDNWLVAVDGMAKVRMV